MGKAENTIVVQTERKWGCLAFLLVFVAGAALGVFGTSECFRDTTKMVETPDTVYVPETLEIPSPPVTEYIKIPYGIPVPVKESDTVRVHDTLYMYLDKEVKEYRDSNFFARVSGYQPSLDFIEIYPKTTIITKTERIAPSKNSISLGMNVGYLNTFSIPIYLEYERKLQKNVDFHARMMYDMPSKSIGAEIGTSVTIGW